MMVESCASDCVIELILSSSLTLRVPKQDPHDFGLRYGMLGRLSSLPKASC